MSQLSIVIVNYNVKYFLKQCIQSIYNSDFDHSYEIIVVDNNSHDDSLDMLSEDFPDVKVIANKENVGFSKANNQGFALAQSEYILILNPDTVIKEDTLRICHDRIQDDHVGAIGVKMIDGKGQYLPESKRGFPTPIHALWKMIGLSRLFPKSAFFNKYYMGYLDDNKEAHIDVLTGAFLWTKKEILDKVGGFDEDYFMYGEDIELSYQIKKEGYELLYLPTTDIIHFKGESTKKSSINYLKNFYGAMGIYARKRNSGNGMLWKLVLQTGIILSAISYVIKSLSREILKPLFDMLLLFSLAKGLQLVWGSFYFDNPDYYSGTSTDLILLAMIGIVITTYYLFGQYDNRHNIKHLGYGFIFGSLAMLSIYSLLPEDLRFSRFILIMVSLLSPIVLYITRRLYNLLSSGTSSFNSSDDKRISIVGSKASCDKINKIVASYAEQDKLVGHITVSQDDDSLGNYNEIADIVESRNINELIFCSKDLSSEYIFNSMAILGNKLSYKIADDDNRSILGSDSKNKVGEWYALDIVYKIDQAFHIRTKRLLDIVVGLLVLIVFPFVLLFSKNRSQIFKSLLQVLIGQKTWIGYTQDDKRKNELPIIKSGVFTPEASLTHMKREEVNLYYSRNYSIWMELELIWHTFFRT